MPCKNRIYILLTYLPILSIWLFSSLMRSRTHSWDQIESPPGCYTAQQIVRLTKPIGSVLAPRSAELSFSPTLVMGQDRTGTKARRKWVVEVSDSGRGFKGTILCDADTGLVEQVSLSQNVPTNPSSSSKLTATDAAEVALRWLAKLNMTQEKTWRLASTPEYRHEQWHCRFVSSHARAFVTIAAQDGQLYFARTVPTSIIGQ